MRIMVTGGRDWTDRETIRKALQKASGDVTDVVLIHGNATGADTIARDIALELGWYVQPYPADWVKDGKAAGAIRNAAMVASKPDVVLAFPTKKSKGTWDAVNKAKAAGIHPVVYV